LETAWWRDKGTASRNGAPWARMKTIPNPYLSLRVAAYAVAVSCAATVFGQTGTHADTSHAATASGNVTTTDSTADHSNHSTLKHTDRNFIEKAAELGREEVEVSRIAAEKAANPDVKHFAQMMVDDHTQANQQLMSIASARNVKLKDKDKNENKWSKKDANDFDRDYVKKMVADHKKVIELFNKESKDGADAELVEFARSTLPKLNHHLEEANNLEKTVK
jgi:putative membrane protein